MNERDEVFRNRLIALMTDLNAGDNRDPALRREIATMATRLHRDARARSWGDLKQRADGATYDSLLQLFQKQSEEATRNGESVRLKAIELLAISLIARRQYGEDLQPGIQYLDKFIDDCERQMRPSPVQKPKPLST